MNKILQLLSLLFVCVYPNLFMYFQNAGEAHILDVIPIIALYVFVAMILLVLSKLIMKDIVLAITLTNIIMLVLINFEFFLDKIGELPYKRFISIVCLCVLIFLFACIIKKKKEMAKGLNLIFFITFLSLSIINAILAIPVIIHKMNIEVEKPAILSSIDTNNLKIENSPPNIYYLIFDEYGGKANLENYFKYDNRDFLQFLADCDFNISNSSKNEESVGTTVIVPNLLNLDYVVNDSMIEEEKLAYMKEPELYKVMQYLGYDIVTCSSSPFLDNAVSIRNYEEQDVFEEKAGYFVLKNSCFIHIYNKYVEKKTLNNDSKDKSYGDLLKEAFSYYEKLSYDNGFGTPPPKICIGYFQAPHVPFFYRSDGTVVPQDEQANWLNQDNYIEYLKWTNGKIEELVNAIIRNDINSIIIIQSDHGARYPIHVSEFLGEDSFNSEDRSYQYNILNCLYYKGEKKDIEGLSGINTLRYVLNEEFNTNLKMIYYDDN